MAKLTNHLTLETVRDYINDIWLENDLHALDYHEISLNEPVDPERINPKYLRRAPEMRASMINYVARVRNCLNGPS